ncbi:MAG: bifunctional DNA-formamidopyrimidine glycosylase/DNA-(apurinic or apyrimidinic site) lyase [Candidatus Omnitrophica bacterium]|nr:bifunctional DNA-formamidopyrimidine glycosylase/DNA-(apurinic or apyrimidinic site) lyase [Candidatus Omnitrophota bacterium]
MPELPEVETIARDLRKIVGQTIVSVQVNEQRVCGGMTSAQLSYRLKKLHILNIYRRGKALVFELDKLFLIIQLGMTGQLVLVPARENAQDGDDVKFAKVIFKLSNGAKLIYNDQRMFGRIRLAGSLDEVKYFRSLGPEPLLADFNKDYVEKNIAGRRIAVKVLLMDGKFVAGIGNIYASEILFEAKIDPRTTACSLKPAQISLLVKAVKKILEYAVLHRGTTLRNYRDASGEHGQFAGRLKVYGRGGKPCLKCGQLIKKIVQAQRSTFYCEKCQIL